MVLLEHIHYYSNYFPIMYEFVAFHTIVSQIHQSMEVKNSSMLNRHSNNNIAESKLPNSFPIQLFSCL